MIFLLLFGIHLCWHLIELVKLSCGAFKFCAWNRRKWWQLYSSIHSELLGCCEKWIVKPFLLFCQRLIVWPVQQVLQKRNASTRERTSIATSCLIPKQCQIDSGGFTALILYLKWQWLIQLRLRKQPIENCLRTHNLSLFEAIPTNLLQTYTDLALNIVVWIVRAVAKWFFWGCHRNHKSF